MRLHSYIVEHDKGFAPNPFHGICTLATCKPKIRQYAKQGEYVIGTGTMKRQLQGRLTYIMRVGEITTFDQYWLDGRFIRKKALMNGSFAQRHGDNIYHRDVSSNEWVQEDSFHSQKNGVLDVDNLTVDTGSTDQVLIADWFIYWGGDGPTIPPQFDDFVHHGIGHHCIYDNKRIAEFVAWAGSKGPEGVNGEPAEWRFPKKSRRRT
jgi:hypothetical protein